MIGAPESFKPHELELISSILRVFHTLASRFGGACAHFLSTFVSNRTTRAWLEAYAIALIQPEDKMLKDLTEHKNYAYHEPALDKDGEGCTLHTCLLARVIVHYETCINMLHNSEQDNNCLDTKFELLIFLVDPDKGLLLQIVDSNDDTWGTDSWPIRKLSLR